METMERKKSVKSIEIIDPVIEHKRKMSALFREKGLDVPSFILQTTQTVQTDNSSTVSRKLSFRTPNTSESIGRKPSLTTTPSKGSSSPRKGSSSPRKGSSSPRKGSSSPRKGPTELFGVVSSTESSSSTLTSSIISSQRVSAIPKMNLDTFPLEGISESFNNFKDKRRQSMGNVLSFNGSTKGSSSRMQSIKSTAQLFDLASKPLDPTLMEITKRTSSFRTVRYDSSWREKGLYEDMLQTKPDGENFKTPEKIHTGTNEEKNSDQETETHQTLTPQLSAAMLSKYYGVESTLRKVVSVQKIDLGNINSNNNNTSDHQSQKPSNDGTRRSSFSKQASHRRLIEQVTI